MNLLAEALLTVTESKKLIGMAVAELEVVKKALKVGIIVVKRGSTNAFVMEQFTNDISYTQENFVCGINIPKGTCISLWGKKLSTRKGVLQWVLRSSKFSLEVPDEVVKEMGENDVYITGANALDTKNNAAVMVVSESGGTIGRNIKPLLEKKVKLIIPVGLEKLISVSINEIIEEIGLIRNIDLMQCGRPFKYIALPGIVITEIEAINILTGATAIHVGSGGLEGAEGSVQLLIKGTENQVEKAMKLLYSIKGTKLAQIPLPECINCRSSKCHHHGKLINFDGKLIS